MNIMLQDVEPMPLTLIHHPFDDEDFLFENKWDGLRCLSYLEDHRVILKSRNLHDITRNYPELASLSSSFIGDKGILDGELCILDRQGHPQFKRILHSSLLKNPHSIERRTIEEPVTYIIWDLLYYNGEDLRPRSLIYRREILEEVLQKGPHYFLSKTIEREGKALFLAAKEEGLEGIVAKKKKSPYLSRLNPYWLKIKCFQYVNAIIGGYIKRKGVFLVGISIAGDFLYIGSLSSALKEVELSSLYKTLKDLEHKECPFSKALKKKDVIWVKPVIECRVRYLEFTHNLRLRHGLLISIEGSHTYSHP